MNPWFTPLPVDVGAVEHAAVVEAVDGRALPGRRARLRVVDRGEHPAPLDEPVVHPVGVDVDAAEHADLVDGDDGCALPGRRARLRVVDRGKYPALVDEPVGHALGVGITSDHYPEVVDTYRVGGRRAGHIDGGVLPVRGRRRRGSWHDR